MPDISMCPDKTCPYRTKCYRSPESGTRPAEQRQAWLVRSPRDPMADSCGMAWPTTQTKEDAAQ